MKFATLYRVSRLTGGQIVPAYERGLILFASQDPGFLFS
jgi:hypothetical protein